MTARSKWRGHDIYYDEKKRIYRYTDTNQPIQENKGRACGNCGRKQTKEGHDGCLGTLKGVMNACCGHGVKEDAYIQYEKYGLINNIRHIRWRKFRKSFPNDYYVRRNK